MSERALPWLFGRPVAALHCVGGCGMGLGPLAIYLARLGFRVSGEDDAPVEAMRRQLARAGVRWTERGAIPADVDLVVISSAIAPGHPTAVAAQARGLPLARRGEVLAEVTRERRLVAVCGSHGKTTTTAMLVAALRASGFGAGHVLGGLFNDDALPPAAVGEPGNDWVVAEVDESDGTIDRFAPAVTVAVNLDWDHPDRYGTWAQLEAAFRGLLERTREAVLTPLGIGGGATPAAWTFGRDERCDFRGQVAEVGGGGLRLRLGGRFTTTEARVRTWGEFNAMNAVAACAAAQVMGATLTPAALAAFPGVRRRQGVLHADERWTVLEDYAHHPAEIEALLTALRAPGGAAVNRRLLVVFQSHRFSRTRQFRREFARVLARADRLYLLETYGAGEAPMAGGTAADLREELRGQAPGLAVAGPEPDAAAVLAEVAGELAAGDVVIFVGAGDIDQHARTWLAGVRAAEWDRRAGALRERLPAEVAVKREEPLADKTTLRVGGAARIYVEPANVEALGAVIRWTRESGVPWQVLGRGSNLLVPDEGVDAVVVSLRHRAWETFDLQADGTVRVGAGLRLKNLCGLAKNAGLVGFEFLEGIPGNLGGALRMNAGAMGGWMFDVVERVELMTREGEVVTRRRDEMHVDYRHCAELKDAIALAAVLRPKGAGDAAAIERQVEAYRQKRQKTQPREASAGCIFKNPEGDSAGRLIDVCGLKGERFGGAEVSLVHGNFIVNRGGATSAEVIELVRRVRARVAEQAGVTLQPEVLLYGRQWEEFL